MYVSFKSIPEGDVDKFIKDLKDYLALRWAGKDIKIVFNIY